MLEEMKDRRLFFFWRFNSEIGRDRNRQISLKSIQRMQRSLNHRFSSASVRTAGLGGWHRPSLMRMCVRWPDPLPVMSRLWVRRGPQPARSVGRWDAGRRV